MADTRKVRLELDFRPQVLLSGVLSAREEYRSLFGHGLDGMVEQVARQLENTRDTSLLLSKDDLLALFNVVNAGWSFANQMASPAPLTLFNSVGGLEDRDFFDLLEVLAQPLQTHFEGSVDILPVHSADGQGIVVEVTEPIRSHLLEIMSYLKGIHHTIDPEMFDVGEPHFAAAKDLLTRSLVQTEARVSDEERLALETLVSAAWEYSYRSKGSGLPGLQDPEFEQIMKWLAAGQR